MSWRDLLQPVEEFVTLPWVGGRALQTVDRRFQLEGPSPREHGWYVFQIVRARAVRHVSSAAAPESGLSGSTVGYLVGDRLVPDGVRVETDPTQLMRLTERVHLVEPGLARFARVSAGRPYEGGPLVYMRQEMPLGPEEEVLRAFCDRLSALKDIRGVVPALDVAFRFETWRRAETERRREQEREARAREAAQRALEARMAQLRGQLGTGAGRRELAVLDFAEAARSALAVGGAEYLDSRDSYNRGEKVVQFRLSGRRFECTCDAQTLRIVDAGICLTDERTGEKGDSRFTLESFPGVILEAIADDKLVVWRHVD